jgi:hypothetical protein
MRTTLLFLIILVTVRGYSQRIPIGFHDCEHEYVWAVVTEPPTWAIDSITLADYLNHELLKRAVLLDNAEGSVVLDLIIFEDGRPCCSSILNKTSITWFPYEDFKKMIDNMPYWNPGKQSDKVGNVRFKLILEMKRGVFTDIFVRIEDTRIHKYINTP